MHKGIKRALLLGSFVAFSTVPSSASAQDIVANLGPLHIRVVDDAPPPIRYERRPVSPGRKYVWIGGYWDRRGNSWDWTPGRWETKRDGRYGWVKARYVREGRSWRYEPGHWQNERLDDSDYRRWRNERRRR